MAGNGGRVEEKVRKEECEEPHKDRDRRVEESDTKETGNVRDQT